MCELFNITNVFEARFPDLTELKRAQMEDDCLRLLKEHLSSDTKPSFEEGAIKEYRQVWRKLYLDDGLLMKKGANNGVIVVPENMVSKVLFHVHDGPASGHFGISKCYGKIMARYYFPKMVTKLADYIENCFDCVKRKLPKKDPRPEIQPISVDHSDIGGTISYDFKGPLPPSDKSTLYQCTNRFVLVIIDHASRYVQAYPTPTMEAKVVAEIMISHWIPRFGIPRVIISDRAKTFAGSVLRTIYNAMHIEVNLTAAYNPSCNGLVEQVNRNISNLMRVLMDEGINNWPNKLNMLFSAYNATPHSTTGYSPNYIIFARELIEPLDTLLCYTGVRGTKEQRVMTELEERVRLRRKALEILQEKMDAINVKVRTKSAEVATAKRFVLGEIVGFNAPSKAGKLKRSCQLNHEVVKVMPPSTYVIKNTISGFERVVNARKLRKIKNQKIVTEQQLTDNLSNVLPSDCSSSDGDAENEDTDGPEATETNDVDDDKRRGPPEDNDETGKPEPWELRLRQREKLKKPVRYGQSN